MASQSSRIDAAIPADTMNAIMLEDLARSSTAHFLLPCHLGNGYQSESDEVPESPQSTEYPEPIIEELPQSSISSRPSNVPWFGPQPARLPLPSTLESPLAAPWRYTILNVYHRLHLIVLVANLVTFIVILARKGSMLAFIDAAAMNLLISGLARHPMVINATYICICALPRSAPLRLRRIAAKISHYGGVHSGCGVAAAIWYLGFIGKASRDFANHNGVISAASLVLSYLVLILLLSMILVAHPTLRFKMHNQFELIHRFFGWLIILLFWPLLFLIARKGSHTRQQPLARFLITLPAFWILLLTTLSIIHPWLSLRRVRVTPEPISTHAIRLHFYHTTIRLGQGFAIARQPLRDWHGFAAFPDSTGISFSCLVSKAGDWTSDCIARPPAYVWKRGWPIYGFGHAMKLFHRIVTVTTGSGIGPVLSFLGGDKRPAMRVVWQTKNPSKTYGPGILDLIARLDPDPVVIDTDKVGRQDMLPLVWDLVQDFRAEAVCVVSNPVITRKLVFELEARGVPAYGPLFDS